MPLDSEDIRRGGPRRSMKERLARLTESLKRLRVRTPIDHRDTLAFVLFDGGKGDFRQTLLHDGHKA